MNKLIDPKLRKIDVPILSAYLTSPIFIPVSKRVNRDEVVFRRVDIFTTKNIKIKAKVPLLDMSVDFPIWALAIKELSNLEGVDEPKINIPENIFLKKLGLSKNNINLKNKRNIDQRLEAMLSSMITIEYYSDEGEFLEKNYVNLFSSAKWSREHEYFEFSFNPDIYGAYDRMNWKSIDIKYYKAIRTEHAKALFLFYESHADYLIPIERKVLVKRLNLENYSRNNNVNQKLKEAHNLLKEIGFIKSYEIKKENNKEYYHVKKVKKQKRLKLECAAF